MTSEKLWTRDFIFLSFVFLVIQVVFYLLLVTVGPYAEDHFNATPNLAGLVTGIYMIGVLLGRLFTGRSIGTAGYKKMLLIGMALFTIVMAMHFGAANIFLLLLFRFVHGVGIGIALTATATIIPLIVPVARRGEGISYWSIAGITGGAIGPVIGIWLVQYFNFNVIYLFCVLAAASGLFMSWMTKLPTVEAKEKQAKTSKGLKLTEFFEITSIPISIVVFFIGFAFSGVLSFLTMYARTIGLLKAASFFFLVYSVVIIISRLFTGRIMDRKGPNVVLYPCIVALMAGIFLMSQSYSGGVLLAAAALIGFGYGNFNSVAQAVAVSQVTPQRMGPATSTYFIALEIGIGIGPYILGSLVSLIGYRDMYLFLVAVTLVTLFLYYLLVGNKHGKNITAKRSEPINE